MRHSFLRPAARLDAPIGRLLLGTLLALSGPAAAADGRDQGADDGKGLFSVTRPTFGLVDGVLFVGTGTGRLDGTGSLTVFSQAEPAAEGRPATPAVACRGRFEHNFRSGKGQLSCNNGETADFTFRFTGLTEGVGEGQSKAHGPVRFTFGLDAEEAARELGLPAGTRIRAVEPGTDASGPTTYRLEEAAPKVGEATAGARTAPLPSPASTSLLPIPSPAPPP